jgi:hypothetical protein
LKLETSCVSVLTVSMRLATDPVVPSGATGLLRPAGREHRLGYV